jgi:hypothetical protein
VASEASLGDYGGVIVAYNSQSSGNFAFVISSEALRVSNSNTVLWC